MSAFQPSQSNVQPAAPRAMCCTRRTMHTPHPTQIGSGTHRHTGQRMATMTVMLAGLRSFTKQTLSVTSIMVLGSYLPEVPVFGTRLANQSPLMNTLMPTAISMCHLMWIETRRCVLLLPKLATTLSNSLSTRITLTIHAIRMLVWNT